MSTDEIRFLAELAGGVELLLSKKSPKYKEYRDRAASPEDWIAFMAEEPRLIKRPILVEGGQILIGFDQDAWTAAVKR
ncbi:arsenate reductase family protein [Sulfobacillus harzensis]|uniref:arsenate reductase family protein n=1 Tax=Sulfobacillus harzensis TaxID=2729629 RepID=UPI001FAE3ACE|nr:ArsC/Spx/MgsR family protein [Sulfobacillus harzensis]